jgi:glycerol-1-phosphate dehydrogenase [NAD(P)+]
MTAQTKLGWHTLGASFDCECGQRHALPIEACHIGEDAAVRLGAFSRERCASSVLLVSDENTWQAGGEKVEAALVDAGKRIVPHQFSGELLEASAELAESVAQAGADADFYVAVGAGTLSDLAKSAASEQSKPVLLFPTAASMNGYSSGIVALKVRGLKRTLPCRPATGIFSDPTAIATAPQRMNAAGLADFLSKASSAPDWRAAHLLRGDYYCPRPREFNEEVEDRLLEAASGIGQAHPEAIHVLMEALLLSGFGMVVAGSSAPASGGEHLISHYLDMKHALYGTPNDLHGAQVGVGTVYTLGLWQKILTQGVGDIEALVAQQPTEARVEAEILEDWGETVGAEVLAQWREKTLDGLCMRAELQRFETLLPTFRNVLPQDLLTPERAARAIIDAGGPATPDGLFAPKEEFDRALRRARYLRNRFTVLDLAAELGLA